MLDKELSDVAIKEWIFLDGQQVWGDEKAAAENKTHFESESKNLAVINDHLCFLGPYQLVFAFLEDV